MSVANYIPEIWAAALLEPFPVQSQVLTTINRDYEGIAQKGNVVHISGITRPTIKDYKAAGRVVSYDDLDDSTLDLLIDQEKYYGFKVDDVDRKQVAGSLEPVTADAAQGLIEDAESFVLNMMLTEGTPSATATASVATGDAAFDLVGELKAEIGSFGPGGGRAPASGRFLVINSEFAKFLLRADSKLTDVDRSGMSEALRDATVGRLLGYTIWESGLLNPGTPTAIGYHRQAVTYVNQLEKPEAMRDPNSFSDLIRGLHVYGGKVTRPESVRVWTA